MACSGCDSAIALRLAGENPPAEGGAVGAPRALGAAMIPKVRMEFRVRIS